MTNRLILRRVPRVEHRRNDRVLTAHLLKRLDVVNDALCAAVHHAADDRHVFSSLVNRNANGTVAFFLRQRHCLAVRSGYKNAVQSAVHAVAQKLAEAFLVHTFLFVQRRDDRRNDAVYRFPFQRLH